MGSRSRPEPALRGLRLSCEESGSGGHWRGRRWLAGRALRYAAVSSTTLGNTGVERSGGGLERRSYSRCGHSIFLSPGVKPVCKPFDWQVRSWKTSPGLSRGE